MVQFRQWTLYSEIQSSILGDVWQRYPKLNLVREAEANEREDQKMRQNEGEKCNIDNILEARGDIKEKITVIAPTRQQDYRPAASDLRNNRVAE